MRARDLGINIAGTPGKYNGITDVAGVEVGFSTIIKGTPEDYTGDGSNFARTGVTAILPRGKKRSAVFVGRHDLNGNGELTGTHWMDDSGFLHGPIMITNTNSVGIVRDTTSKWMIDNSYYYPLYFEGEAVPGCGYFYPAVGETWDGLLNDTNGFHVKAEHALEALNNATTGPVQEGNIGGGTGMQCHEFKGGTGTASRVLSKEEGGYTVGALVQANHGVRDKFEISGIPVGKLIKGYEMEWGKPRVKPGTGSIIVVIATDAPVMPIQLHKMCKRIQIGLGRLGGGYENGSGDIFIGFSTANEKAYTLTTTEITLLGDDLMDPIYKAVAETVEEAVLNAMCAAETMEGQNHNVLYGLPHDQIRELMKNSRK